MNKVCVYDYSIDEPLYEFYKGNLWLEVTPEDYNDKELMRSLDDYVRVRWVMGEPLSEYNPYSAQSNVYLCCNYREPLSKEFIDNIMNGKHPYTVRCTSDKDYALRECGAQKILNVKDFVPKLSDLKPVEENELEEIMNG